MTDALTPLRHLYGEGATPPAPPEPGTATHAEYVLLTQTRAALERLPRLTPEPAVVEAVVGAAARAAREAAALAPLRHAYAEDPPGAPPAPDEAAYAEYVLLRTTRAALDRLPRPTPDSAVVAAIAAAVAQAAAKVPVAPGSRIAPDRAPAAGRPARRRWPALAGLAALLVAAVTGLWVTRWGPGEMNAVADASTPEPAPESAPAAPASPEPAVPSAVSAPAPPPPDLIAANGPVAVAAEPERRAPAALSARPRNEVPRLAEPSPDPPSAPAVASAPAAPAAPAVWDAEADGDVRLLSLRLQALREQNEGLAWDEMQSIPFGAADEAAGAEAPAGLQSVRAGAPPARVEVRMQPPADD